MAVALNSDCESLQLSQVLRRKGTPADKVAKVVIRSIAHGRYLSDQKGGCAKQQQRKQEWEAFILEDVGDGTVAIKSEHGNYLSLNPNHGDLCFRGHREDWERWYIKGCDCDGDLSECYLQNAHFKDHFVSARDDGWGKLTCQPRVQAWEKFKITPYIQVVPKMTVIFSCPKGVDGVVEHTFKAKSGYSSTQNISNTINAQVSASVSAWWGGGSAEASAKMSTQNTISTSIQNQRMEEVSIKLTLNLNKPTYIYQLSCSITVGEVETQAFAPGFMVTTTPVR